MEINENYKGSYIFSEVISSLKNKGHKNKGYTFPDLSFLEKKNNTINSFNNIDFYCLIDIQKEGEFILEKNISLNIGLKKNSIKNIINQINDDSLRVDAEMDKTFTEFHIKNKLAPLDMVLSNVNPIISDGGQKFFLKRTICIISNDQNGIPLFGFCAISVVNQIEDDFNSKNFNIYFTNPNENLEKELKSLILKAIN